ncbi:hypothetical protein MARLIPOL_03370 [Marinobacter lipolyticus SM19]|uniref:DUF5666 domain-containing protein n=1 Tax=Marinobacter lipolyticus SM19 TaxID=1318628 RepID=R8B370_9GAMM|nr:DUF5666 domain-containing protein [Marinobacter lipolyticus]EON93040.1 hypothetical protein MARLIPOL_03370 [Marinobacter lipolyticus SM19]
MKPNTMYRYRSVSAGALVVVLISGCGGGGGGSVDVAEGGIRGTGASVGPVSGFGSVFVNGIRFETDGSVTSDDGISREDQLDEGMILRIDGQWRADGEGTAEQVEYDDTFRGEVVIVSETFDPDDSSIRESVTFTVYGQTIVADKQTVFKGMSLQTIDSGAFVRVSGWRLPDGRYRASYVGSLEVSLDDVEIEGRIDDSSVDVDLNRFSINGFPVEYDNTTNFGDGLTESDLNAPGLVVEVEGRIGSVDGASGLIANNIEQDESRRYQRGDDDDIEFAGPVATAFDDADSTFTINGLTVLVPDDAVFEDGLTSADLQPGLLIQVEGNFLADGRVEAEEIDIRDANAQVEGPINQASIDFSNRTFLVGGVLVRVTPLTIITDDDDDQRIGLADLSGAFDVEVEGIERSTNGGGVILEATKVEREIEDEAGNEFEVTGRLGAIDDTTVTVLGVRIRAVEGETEFDGIQRDQLMADFESGERPLIEVDYVEQPSGSSNFVADEVELED